MQSLQCENQVENLLRKEGFTEDVIRTFRTECIDDEAFLLLEDRHMEMMGLKMGIRLKLAKLLENTRKELSRGVYVFIDNSNLWINAKRVAKPSRMVTKEDHRVRIEFGKLTEYVSRGREIRKVFVCGSRPPPADSVWDKMREHGCDVDVKERSSRTGKEKGIDSQIGVGMLDVFFKQEPETIVLISGDADMLPHIEYILRNNEKKWKVEVCSWQDSTASCLKNLPGRFGNAQVTFLDQESITFTEWKFNANFIPEGSTRVVLHMEPGAFPNNKPTDDWCREVDAITQWPFQYYWAGEYENESEDLVLVFKQEWNGIEFNREVFLQNIVENPISMVRMAMLHEEYCKQDYYEYEDEDAPTDIRCIFMYNCQNGFECPYSHSDKEMEYFANNGGIGNRFRKVRACEFYLSTGCDKVAENCDFAHGPEDAWCLKCKITGHYCCA